MAKQAEVKKKTMAEKVADLSAKRARMELGGGRAHRKTARVRQADGARADCSGWWTTGSFQEIGLFAQHRATYFGMAGKEMPADGVVTGCANIDGRQVHLASQDFTVGGGAAGERRTATRCADMMRLSLKTGQPVRLHQRLRRRARSGGH
jgi:methylmalonyl-CoA carboxyltransferase large subunit